MSKSNTSEKSKKSVSELKLLCKEKGIKGYSAKRKEELLKLLEDSENKEPNEKEKKEGKVEKGQFYTTNVSYIFEGFSPPSSTDKVIEPFTGKGDLVKWLISQDFKGVLETYDIDPKYDGTICQDTLTSPPDYTDSWVITNPPYLARNKSDYKSLYDKYNTNDLYKCFMLSLSNKAKGGIIIIPAGFFFSPRPIDVRCRSVFMKFYKLVKVKYFEETVFDDTTTAVVAIQFEKSSQDLIEQSVQWEFLPSKVIKTFTMSESNNWIIGGEIYKLPAKNGVSVRRHVEGRQLSEGEQQTFITLNALDSGTSKGRISLSYKKDYLYPAKECSRTYATLRLSGICLSEDEQKILVEKFNNFLEEKREQTHSLFLPQFRESKEYARKRIPFELAYSIILHLIEIYF